ncbi:MAG: carboxypeptidase-like regulatory domain-containing protein [Nanoarchaeota archaeon]
MVSKKRGTFRVVLAIVIAIFLFSASQSLLFQLSPLFPSSPAWFSSASAEMEGCYTYAKGSESVYCKSVLESEAQKDCSKFTDCDIKERFIPGSDCLDLSECAEITCNVDCQTHALGKCEQMGTTTLPGKAVADEEYTLWCDVGCCKFPQTGGKNYCTANIKRYSCFKNAAQNGVTDTQKIFFDNSGTIDAETCKTVYCGLNLLSSSIEVHVQDAEGKILDGATIVLEGEALEKTTDASGKASFLTLTPKNYLLKVGKEGYLSVSLAVPLAQNTTANQTVTLSKLEGAGVITGIVTGEDALPLAKATLSWENSAKGISGKTTADAQGQYTFSNLPPGNYVVTASQLGYTLEKKTLEVKEGSNPLNFMLKSAALLGVKGTTYIDTNNNGKQDGEDEHPYGVKIYVGGVLRGQSQYPDGKFEFSLQVGTETETHNISATYQNYQLDPLPFEIDPGETLNLDLFLTTYVGECSKGQPNEKKNVEEFLALPVVGKKEVYVSWKKPCAETIAYTLEKYSGSEKLDTISLPHTAKEFTDGINGELEWGKTYTYKISATYDSGLESAEQAEQTLTLGDEACEGRYNELTGWNTFCFGGDKEIRKKVWTCNDQNQLLGSDNCAEKDGPGENYYCARISSAVAGCKNTGACSLNANPFGLYYGQESCYGVSNYAALLDGEQEPKNYCYYDYTASVVDQCKECTEVNVKSCFDYQSKDACNEFFHSNLTYS